MLKSIILGLALLGCNDTPEAKPKVVPIIYGEETLEVPLAADDQIIDINHSRTDTTFQTFIVVRSINGKIFTLEPVGGRDGQPLQFYKINYVRK